MLRPQFGINSNAAPQQPDPAGTNHWDTNGWGPLVVGVGASATRLVPSPVGVGITITTDILSRAANHMPMNSPLPNVPMNPNWVSRK